MSYGIHGQSSETGKIERKKNTQKSSSEVINVPSVRTFEISIAMFCKLVRII